MAFEKLNTQIYSEGDRVMYEAGLSQDFRNQILSNSDRINEKFWCIKEQLQSIFNLKNKACKHLTEIYKDFEDIFNWSLKNNEFENLFKFSSVFENDERFSIQNLTKIQWEKDEKLDQSQDFKVESLILSD